MIMIDKLVVGYSVEVDILKGMFLYVEYVEIIMLFGFNGCGKLILFKIIVGFFKLC